MLPTVWIASWSRWRRGGTEEAHHVSVEFLDGAGWGTLPVGRQVARSPCKRPILEPAGVLDTGKRAGEKAVTLGVPGAANGSAAAGEQPKVKLDIIR